MLRVIITILFCLSNFIEGRISYGGHHLIRTFPETLSQYEFLRDAAKEYDNWNFWSEPHPRHLKVDFSVSHDDAKHAFNELRKHGLSFKVVVADLEQLLLEEMRKNEIARIQSDPEQFWFTAYHNHDEILQWLDIKASECGQMCSTFNLAPSYEGRELKVFKISSGSGKPGIWIDATIHAREWIAPAVAMYFIERFVDDYDTDQDVRDMINQYDFYILSVLNPDGYDYTWTNDRLWRKTRSRVDGQVCVGTDANRNFDFMWNTIGTSTNPCSDIYAGPNAFSEPEAATVADFIISRNGTWQLFLTLHSHGQLVLTPWGYTPSLPPDYDELFRVGSLFASAVETVHGTVYEVGSAANILYASSGTSRDWAKGVPRISYVYTFELRDTGEHGFILPPDQIIPSGEETWFGLKTLISEMIPKK